MKVYQSIASSLQAIINCKKNNNQEWLEKHTDSIEAICKEYLPHGSGFDCGTTIDFEKSNPDKLVFNSAYHHMDENGFYDGWSELKIVVTPSLAFDFNLKITGIRRKNKFDSDYYHEEFNFCLNKEVTK